MPDFKGLFRLVSFIFLIAPVFAQDLSDHFPHQIETSEYGLRLQNELNAYLEIDSRLNESYFATDFDSDGWLLSLDNLYSPSNSFLENQAILIEKFHYCIFIWNYECAFNTSIQYSDLGKSYDIDDQNMIFFLARVMLYLEIGSVIYTDGIEESYLDLMQGSVISRIDYNVSIDQSLINARLAFRKEDYDRGLSELDKAFTAITSVKLSDSNSRHLVRSLLILSQMYNDLNDKRSYLISSLLSEYVDKTYSINHPEKQMLMELLIIDEASYGDFNRGLEIINNLENELSQSKGWQFSWLSRNIFEWQKLVFCTSLNESECANEAIAYHYDSYEPDQLDDRLYMIAGYLHSLDQLSDSNFQYYVSHTEYVENELLPEDLTDFYSLGLSINGNVHEANVINTYQETLNTLEYSYFDSVSGYQVLPNDYKLIAKSYLDRLPSIYEDVTASEGDLIFRVFSILQTNIRSEESYYLNLLNKAETELDKFKIHQFIRSRQRLFEYQTKALESWMDEYSFGSELFTNVDMNGVDYTRLDLGNVASSYARSTILNLRDDFDLTTPTTNITLKDLQIQLSDEDLVVSYLLIGQTLYKLFITNESIAFYANEIDLDQFIFSVRLLNLSLTSTHAPSILLDSQFPFNESSYIYNDLFGTYLSQHTDVNHLILLNNETLKNLLPIMSSLVTNFDSSKDLFSIDDANWLGLNYGISYLNDYKLIGVDNNSLSSDLFIGIGNPNFEDLPEPYNSFPELPETEDEINFISNLYDESINLLGVEANEWNLDVYSSDSDINSIAFSTHGLISGEVPGLTQSALLLSPRSDANPYINSDGILTAMEIADYRFNVDFITLASCNSGMIDSNFFASEIRGLTSAFNFAGISKAVVGMWSINSITTSEIIQNMYLDLDNNDSNLSNSLMRAKKQFFEQNISSAYAHPRFWSALAVYGDGRFID